MHDGGGGDACSEMYAYTEASGMEDGRFIANTVSLAR